MNAKLFLSEEEYNEKVKALTNQIMEAYYMILSNSDSHIPLGLALSAAAFAFCNMYETALTTAGEHVTEENLPHFIELMETIRTVVASGTDVSKGEIERTIINRLNKGSE